MDETYLLKRIIETAERAWADGANGCAMWPHALGMLAQPTDERPTFVLMEQAITEKRPWSWAAIAFTGYYTTVDTIEQGEAAAGTLEFRKESGDPTVKERGMILFVDALGNMKALARGDTDRDHTEITDLGGDLVVELVVALATSGAVRL